MNIIQNKKGKGLSVEFHGDLIIRNIAEWKDSILKYFAELKDTEIDLSNIGRIDTAGLQLLISIRKELGKSNKKMQITNASEDVKRIFELYKENF